MERERLLKLLEYANEAIDYWFDSVECSEKDKKENNFFKEECQYFINHITQDKEVDK